MMTLAYTDNLMSSNVASRDANEGSIGHFRRHVALCQEGNTLSIGQDDIIGTSSLGN